MNTLRRTFPLLLAPILVLLLAGAAVADEGDDERRVLVERHVVRDVGDCPKIVVRGDDGPQVRSTVQRGFLGVELTPLSPVLRRQLGLPEDVGVMVEEVVADSPALRAGLRPGDVVTRAGGEEIDSVRDLTRFVREHDGGEVVALEVWRDGAPSSYDVTLEARERCALDFAGLVELGDLDDIDIDVDFEGLAEEGLHVSEEALEQALEALQGIDWSEHLEQLEGLEGRHLEGLDERMEELQQRMQELEHRLEEEMERHGERMEREIEARARALEQAEVAEARAREAMERAKAQARRAEQEARAQGAELERRAEQTRRQLEAEARRVQEQARRVEAEAAEARQRAEQEEARRQAEEEGGGSTLER